MDQSGNPKPMHPMIAKRMLVISRQPINTRFNIPMQLEGKVKTLFFVNQGSTKANIIFNKDQFHIGEQALVKCEIDNSACEKDIKCIKLKFRRAFNANSKCGHKLFI